jgi:alpha-glucosidase
MDYHPEAIDLVVFVPEEDGETLSVLDEDDGVTVRRQSGAFHRTRFTLGRRGDRLTLVAQVSGNGYGEFRRRWFRVRFRGPEVDEVRIERKSIDRDNGVFVLKNRGEDFTLTCRIVPRRR